jgi:hypothetical protein
MSPHQRHGELQRYARVQRPRLIFQQNNCSCRSMPNEKDCRASTAHQRQTEETKRPEKSNAETISKIEQVAGSRQHHKAVVWFGLVFATKGFPKYNDHMNGALSSRAATGQLRHVKHDVKVPIDHFESQMGHVSQSQGRHGSVLCDGAR